MPIFMCKGMLIYYIVNFLVSMVRNSACRKYIALLGKIYSQNRIYSCFSMVSSIRIFIDWKALTSALNR